MATQAERRNATRTRLLDAAEALFVAHGYAGTATEQILHVAGLSRGALYHHFANKREVFEAVFRRVSDAAIARAGASATASDSPLEALIEASLAWLREVQQPGVAAIVLDQGPAVLGWERARDLEAQTSLGLMTRGLARAAAAGEIEVGSLELAARFVNAILAEAALAALHPENAPSDETIEASLRQFIGGLAPR